MNASVLRGGCHSGKTLRKLGVRKLTEAEPLLAASRRGLA